MKLLRLFILFILVSCTINICFSQCTVSITGPSTSVCTGECVSLSASTSTSATRNINISNTTTYLSCGETINFYDNGGPNGNYSSSVNYVHTFISSGNTPLTLTFISSYGETCCDYLYVYDGSSIYGNQLYYGLLNSLAGRTFTSTGNSLTIKFTSDYSVQYDGWYATISTGTPTYTWSTGATGSTIRVCPSTTTTYTVTANVSGCCTATRSYTINPSSCENNCNDFEDLAARSQWTLVNGSQTNQWVINRASTAQNGGTYSLYISNSPTASLPSHNYSTSTTSNVWAYMDIEFPECDEDFLLSFDWLCGGESYYDYIRFWIGDLVSVSAGSSTAPSGATVINNPTPYSSSYPYYFNTATTSSTWHHVQITLSHATYSGRTKRLFILWHNDSSSGYMYPGAVDNVCIRSCQSCNRPIVNVTPSSAAICQGNQVTMTASASGGSGGGYTYTWAPASSLSSTTGTTVTASPQESTVYTVVVTDNAGCSKTVRIPVTITGGSLDITASQDVVCQGMGIGVNLTATLQASSGCSSYTYRWSSGQTSRNITVYPNSTTTYTLSATPTNSSCCPLVASTTITAMDCGANGCPSIAPAELGTGYVEIYRECADTDPLTLEANVVATAREANDYTVISIPYNPPYSYTAGNRIFTNARDDTWGELLNLPFGFCFYGNVYHTIRPGSNSVATFSNSYSTGSGCAWSYSASLPSTSLFPNTIFACYRDIYPNYYSGDGIYQGVLGSYPCRSYVLSFNNIALYSCTSTRTFTVQIVLYEGTNIIDIYLRKAPTCTSWNRGNGVIGIQDATRTRAVVPPGRNTGSWVATNEAWRFIPTGQPVYTVTWYEGTDTTAAHMIGTGDVITVTPPGSTYYTARLRYTACNGDHFDLINTCHVTMNNVMPGLSLEAEPDTVCPGQSTTITAITQDATSFTWSTGETSNIITPTPTNDSETYSVTVTYSNGCYQIDSITVYKRNDLPIDWVDTTHVLCYGFSTGRLEVEATGGVAPYSYQWESDNNYVFPNPMENIADHLPIGNYSVTVTDAHGCYATVTYEIVYLTDSMIVGTVSSDQVICEGTMPESLTTSGSSGGDQPYYEWQISTDNTNFTSIENTNSTTYQPDVLYVPTYYRVAYISDSCGILYTNSVLIDIEYPYDTTIYDTICPSPSYIGNGFVIQGTDIPGEFEDSIVVSMLAGCDSITRLQLHVSATSDTVVYRSITENELPYEWNGLTFNGPDSMMTVFTNQAGCDSTVNMVLHVFYNVSVELDSTICENALPIIWEGQTFNEAGTQVFIIQASTGADSTVALHLHTNPVYHQQVYGETCQYEAYIGHGFTASGDTVAQPRIVTLTHLFSSSLGCDSIVTLRLTIHPVRTSEENIIACDSFKWNGQTYYESGRYSNHFFTIYGCDSIVTKNVRVINTDMTLENLTEDFCDYFSADLKVTTELEHILWSTGDEGPEITITNAGAYWVHAYTDRCEAIDRIVIPQCEFNLYLPNAITPGTDDGDNDYFCIPEGIADQISEFEIQIFDRWGRMIFASTNPYFRWNGKEKNKLLATYTYVYRIKFTVKGRGKYIYSGTITVL